MTHFAIGSVVAWWDEGALAVAVVAAEEKNRVRLILPNGKEERVAPARIGFALEPAGHVPGASREERVAAGRRAHAAEERLRRRALEVDVPALWEIAREDGEHELSQLASLALGDDSGAARAAVARALLEDAVRFARRGDAFEARSAESVAEIERQRERTALRGAEREAALAALRAALAGEAWRPTGSGGERRMLQALEELAIQDARASDAARGLALEALDRIGPGGDRPAERAFRLLRSIGRFASDDENLFLARHGLRVAFPPEVLEAARAAARRGFERRERADLTALPVVTIDGAWTREIDDGLSVETAGSGALRLGIHIADPGAFVEPGDAVDVEALARTSSHYLPDLRIPMLPAEISEAAASLCAGEERPALSFLVELEPGGELGAFEIARSVIRSRERLDYDEADRRIADGTGPFADGLRAWVEAATRLVQRRREAGALLLAADEVEVRVDADGTITLERSDPRSPSRKLVAEAMVLAGLLAARFCSERSLPALYRRQPPPAGPLPEPGEASLSDPVLVRRIRRSLRRGEIAVQPGPHFALGLAAYTQATSPLRRYQDLVVHRQIASSLAGRPAPYVEEELQRLAATTEAAEAEGRQAERSAQLYWKLRYLESHRAEPLLGVVVDERPAVVLLEGTALEEKVPGLAGAALGERVRLRIEKVNPRAELLVLRPL